MRDEGGNAMLLLAAALIPLLGLIGSGMDLTRGYLVRSKMQTACDAGSLAARRYMAGGTLDAAAIAEGQKFFNFNFPAGTMDAAPVELTFAPDASDVSTVNVTAKTTVPTTIMALFGTDKMAVSVECSADQDYVNNDIMLVLDVTGSMNCTAGTGDSCAYAATEQSTSRLSRVRSATAALYNSLKDARGVRTRYGFMPYSMTVNVGSDLQQSWIREPANYWQKTGNNWAQKSVSHNSLWYKTTWSGCLEERSTISQGGGASIRISSDVAQGDIDQTGVATSLQWAPYDPDGTVGETGAYPNLTTFCPAAAQRLSEYNSQNSFQSAVNASLSKVGGYTNHDLGITWGMRYLSSSGMFATDNPETYRQVPVAKHIIFLTDGEMTADSNNYSAYGIPARETRMVATGALVDRHKARFLNACNRARQMGATIWVIAIDVGATADISPCASGSDRFFVSNGSDLDQVFQRIGKGIGRLRLTQ
ncbi:vWA domain-containing protein [Sphingomonas rosea]